jgi:hypothetical protein
VRQLNGLLSAAIGEQAGGNIGDVENPIDHAGGDGGAGHAVVLGLGGILDDGESAPFLDALDADGAVGVAAGKDDGDGVGPVGIGEGAEEKIDGNALAAGAGQVGEGDVAVEHGELLAGRDDIDGVGQDAGLLDDLAHGHGGVTLKQLGEGAFVLGGKMNDDDEGQAAVGRHPREKGLERGNAAGRSAQADDGEGVVAMAGTDVVEVGRGLVFRESGRHFDR